MQASQIAPLLAALFIAASTGVAGAQAPDKDQQACLATLGKSTLEMALAQGKENRICVNRYARARLVGTADACLDADSAGRLAQIAGRTIDNETKRCSGAAAPDFGDGGGVALIAASQQAELDLVRDLFGDPIDPGLALCDSDKDSCTCQAKVLVSVEKLVRMLGRTHGVCKRKRFSSGAIDDNSELERCLEDPAVSLSLTADPSGKLAMTRLKIQNAIATSCDEAGVTASAFPGACSGLIGAALAQCLADRAECRFCQMVNAAEDTFADCDVFDDASVNSSCDEFWCPVGENACIDGCQNLNTDEFNCGACGISCGPGDVCNSGLCGPPAS